MGNFHSPTKPGLLFITSCSHLAVTLNLHTVTKTAWNKNLQRNYDYALEIKMTTVRSIWEEKSSFSNSWLLWVAGAPAESTFPTANPCFSLCLLRVPCSLHREGFLHHQILCWDNAFSRDLLSSVTLFWKSKLTYVLKTKTHSRDN